MKATQWPSTSARETGSHQFTWPSNTIKMDAVLGRHSTAPAIVTSVDTADANSNDMQEINGHAQWKAKDLMNASLRLGSVFMGMS
jgi:hypothetical protein